MKNSYNQEIFGNKNYNNISTIAKTINAGGEIYE